MKPLYPLGQPEKAIGHEPQIDLCVANEQPPALSASGTDPRRRSSIKMQRSWEKTFRPSGGDFQGMAGLSSDDSLHAENQRRLLGAAQNQASAIAHTGLEVKQLFATSGRGRIFSLTSPFIDQAVTLKFQLLSIRFVSDQSDGECNGDISTIDHFPVG